MKAAKVVLILILIAVLINAVRLGDDFPLPYVFPGLGGMPPSQYDLAGIAMILITLWGLARLRQNRRKADPWKPPPGARSHGTVRVGRFGDHHGHRQR